MFDLKDFYSIYQYDYYVYKLISLKAILDNTEKFKEDYIQNQIDGYREEDFRRVIRSEIRQTYFHSVETVFEIIFALQPSSDSLKDLHILPELINSNWKKNYDRIDRIAQDPKELDFLDESFFINENEITIGRYLFYYGILPENKAISKKHHEMIPRSIEAIKYGLQIIAKDFTKREEYNQYKHTLRIVPAVTSFTLMDEEKIKTLAAWDLKDSLTYVKINKDQSEIKFITKLFDTNRDIALSLFVSNVISNIIMLRKAAFKQLHKEENLPILFFSEEEVKKCSKVGVQIQDIVHTMTKKNKP